MIQEEKSQKGFILLVVLIMASFFIVAAGGLASVSLAREKLFNQEIAKHEALNMAEAGVNYYRWHLAHNHTDFFDGTGSNPGGGSDYGPYVHSYTAPSSNISGKFSLLITPPPTGSTIVKINSTGWVDTYPNTKRVVEVRYGIPSLAHFSFLTNVEAWFGNTEHVIGELHSNGGIRMDGTNDSSLSSARSTFSCPSNLGCRDASHGPSSDYSCNSPCSWNNSTKLCTCPGVFGNGPNSSLWSYPIPAINFSTITMDLNTIQSTAGVSLNTNGSNKGYHIIFKSNGHFDAKLVSALNSTIKQKSDDWTDWSASTGWVNTAETIKTEGAAVDYAIPANGLIMVNDGDVWVEGVVKGRTTLAAATLPDNVNKRRSIYINGNLQYLARDGSNSLGLIAQKDIKILRDTLPCNLTSSKLIIDGILLAQNGRVFRNTYDTPVKCYSIEVYGGVITNQQWTWSWSSGGVVNDGYINTNSVYDPNVTYSPPPSFPTSGEYAFISWEEK